MKYLIVIVYFLCNGHLLLAQSMVGITNVPDTSFTTRSAFEKDRKYHPQIKIVERQNRGSVTVVSDLVYCRLGNRMLHTDVFSPKVKANGIAIVFIHGGGWRSGNRQQHYALAEKLASLGYTVFTPEYRLSTEALFPAAIYDIKSMIRWVRKNAEKYQIAVNKISIGGFSAGGELAAFVGNTNDNTAFEGSSCTTSYSSKVNAIVSIDGTLSFVHPESGEGDDSKKLSAATLWLGYSKKDNAALWEKASPLTYAGKNSVPTLFINSSVARMHAGRDDYMKILNSNNIYTEQHEFDNSPHSFCLYHPWFKPTVNYIDIFLKKVFNSK